jgi:serine/threonine-protein kinase
MASVWVARQRGKHGFEKLVAIKTILPKFAADPRFQSMFLDEARIASRIEHFNVAQIIDLGEEHDVLYLVMEYVDGDSLSKLRRACVKANVPIPHGVLLRLLADACSGLHEAHELKDETKRSLEIVHRDISPHNILVNTKGVAKVIDFGIAKARDRMAGETNAGVLKGKIQYMAPEQALGRKVDRRADLWAVGATLYHLLTGKPPYDADNTLGTLHLLTSGRPPLPLPPSVHPAIGNIVRKALTTSVDHRFQSAAEMRDAIEAAMYEAKVPATTSDAATFLNKQLSERTAKRRQVINIAIAAAAERERIEEVLKPELERSGSGLTSNPPSGRTIAEAPAALRAAGGTDASPGASQRTPVGTVASDIVELPRRSRTGLVVALVAVALAAIGGVAFVTMRSTSAAATRAPSPSASVLAASSTPPVPTLQLPAGPGASSSSAIPEVSFSDLPRASATSTAPPAPPPRPAWQPPRPPANPPSPPANPPPPTKKKVDDGF